MYNDGETKYVEYKKEYTKSIFKTVSAMANYHDGLIVIGIDDDLHVIGVDEPRSVKLNLENAINDNILPRPYYEISEESKENKIIIILKVFSGENTPYLYNNRAYKRMDTSTVPTNKIEYENLILRGRNIGYDALIYEGKSIYLNYLNNKLRDRLGVGVLTTDILKTLGLMNGENYTIAAALLADKNPIDHAGISLVRFDSDLGLNIKDKMILRNISILEQFDKAIEFYHKHINVREIIKGVYRETIEEIPLVAFREAIANAIVHREYMIESDIRVEIFDDRVEIISPGGLPIGITEEEYIDGRVSIPRNRIIADIFLRLGIIERLATGIRRIREYYKNSGVNPEFFITQNSIKVILPKINHKINSMEILNKIEKQLNETELKIMEYVKSTGRITRKEAEEILSLKKTQTVQILRDMLDKGILIKIGAGRNTSYISNA